MSKLQILKNLFFRNIEIRQTIFKNTFWLVLGQIITQFLRLVLVIYAARVLGVALYGRFTFALSFVSTAVVFGDLGLSNLTTRELSRERELEKEYSAIFSLKLFLNIITLILILIGSFLVAPDSITKKIIWILAFYIFISSFSNIIHVFFRARQKMEYEVIAKILEILLIVIIGFFVLFKLPSALNLSYAYLIASSIALLLIFSYFHFSVQPLKLSFNKEIWKRFLKLSWPLTLGFVASWIYVNIDSIMVGYSGGAVQAGWYNATGKIVLAVIVFAGLISRSFYPVLSSFIKESKEKLQRIWDYQMQLMIFLSLPIVAGGFALAPRLINFLYDAEDYSPSILVFKILIFVIGINFLYYPYSMILVVSNQQKKNFWLMLAGGIMNIILNYILFVKYGINGVALATVISSLFVFISAIGLSRYYASVPSLNLRLLKTLTVSVLASMIMFAAIKCSFIYNLNIFLTIITGALIYLIIFCFCFKIFFGSQKLIYK